MADIWSDEENDLVVADYMAMLREELMGRRYVKAHHNQALRERIGRTKGSIEFKHQNVTAVMIALGEPWIIGYKPAPNSQASLVDAVVRHLERSPMTGEVIESESADGLLELGPAPAFRKAPPTKVDREIMEGARKLDVASRQAANKALGHAGEKRVLRHEQARLTAAGREDLAREVRWVSELDGDGAGYDIASFGDDGCPRLLEVKTTNGWDRTPFHISHNELRVADKRRNVWRLVRVWNFARSPRAFELCPPLDEHVVLVPTSFRVVEQ